MIRTVLRWSAFAAALLAPGPVVGLLAGAVPAADGGRHATALVCDAPALGLLFTAAAIGLAWVAGLIGGRLVARDEALACFGLALAWGAWRSASISGLVRVPGGESPSVRLAVEAAMLGVLVVFGVAALVKLSRRPPDRPDPGAELGVLDAGSLKAAGAAVAVGLVVGWAAARNDLPGQSFAAAALAGLFATTVARVVAPGVPYPVLAAAGVVVAALAPAIGGAIGQGPFADRVDAGTVNALARPLPLHWLSGWLLAMPVGVVWAASLGNRAPGESRRGPAAPAGAEPTNA